MFKNLLFAENFMPFLAQNKRSSSCDLQNYELLLSIYQALNHLRTFYCMINLVMRFSYVQIYALSIKYFHKCSAVNFPNSDILGC